MSVSALSGHVHFQVYVHMICEACGLQSITRLCVRQDWGNVSHTHMVTLQVRKDHTYDTHMWVQVYAWAFITAPMFMPGGQEPTASAPACMCLSACAQRLASGSLCVNQSPSTLCNPCGPEVCAHVHNELQSRRVDDPSIRGSPYGCPAMSVHLSVSPSPESQWLLGKGRQDLHCPGPE
jgi:hypothetical protein